MGEKSGNHGIPSILAAERRETVRIEFQPGAVTKDAHELARRVLEDYAGARIIIDSGVFRSDNRLPLIVNELKSAVNNAPFLVLRGGEGAKTLGGLRRIISWLDAQETGRHANVVIAIGGGAVLDVASLAASLFRRGVSFWRIPTTLLSFIDAGLGAKSAINFYRRKNLLGTYRLPEQVIIDPVFLQTVPRRQIRSGLAEAVKMGLAADADLFEMIEGNWNDYIIYRCQTAEGYALIKRAMSTMISQLSIDLWEDDLTHPTDLGHSFSRIMEQLLRPRPLHGEAVAIDIAFSFACSEVQRLCTAADRLRVISLLRSIGLPTTHPDLSLSMLQRAYDDIVVHRDGRLFPFPARPGKVIITELSREVLPRAFDVWKEPSTGG